MISYDNQECWNLPITKIVLAMAVAPASSVMLELQWFSYRLKLFFQISYTILLAILFIFTLIIFCP